MSFLVAFDTSLPAFAASEVRCGDRVFAAGESFPWRELGVTESELQTMWRALVITFHSPAIFESSAREAPESPRGQGLSSSKSKPTSARR